MSLRQRAEQFAKQHQFTARNTVSGTGAPVDIQTQVGTEEPIVLFPTVGYGIAEGETFVAYGMTNQPGSSPAVLATTMDGWGLPPISTAECRLFPGVPLHVVQLIAQLEKGAGVGRI